MVQLYSNQNGYIQVKKKGVLNNKYYVRVLKSKLDIDQAQQTFSLKNKTHKRQFWTLFQLRSINSCESYFFIAKQGIMEIMIFPKTVHLTTCNIAHLRKTVQINKHIWLS